MNPITTHSNVQPHIDQIMRDAGAQRLVNEASSPANPNQFLAALGQQLIRIGEALQAVGNLPAANSIEPVIQPVDTQLARR